MLFDFISGIWKNVDELKQLRITEHVFKPGSLTEDQFETYKEWERAVQRFLNWQEV